MLNDCNIRGLAVVEALIALMLCALMTSAVLGTLNTTAADLARSVKKLTLLRQTVFFSGGEMPLYCLDRTHALNHRSLNCKKEEGPDGTQVVFLAE